MSLRKVKKNGTGDEKQGELQIYLQCFIYWIWKRLEVTDKMLTVWGNGVTKIKGTKEVFVILSLYLFKFLIIAVIKHTETHTAPTQIVFITE